MNPSRPFAQRARELCPDNHDEGCCQHCRLLELRLTPMHMIPGFADLLADANLTVTYRRDLPGGGDEPHCAPFYPDGEGDK